MPNRLRCAYRMGSIVSLVSAVARRQRRKSPKQVHVLAVEVEGDGYKTGFRLLYTTWTSAPMLANTRLESHCMLAKYSTVSGNYRHLAADAATAYVAHTYHRNRVWRTGVDFPSGWYSSAFVSIFLQICFPLICLGGALLGVCSEVGVFLNAYSRSVVNFGSSHRGALWPHTCVGKL